MATQQQAAFDPGQSLLAPGWPRQSARTKESPEPTARQRKPAEFNQLRSYAFLEACSWKILERKKGVSVLEEKWRDAKDRIETKCRALRDFAAAGHALSGDAKTLAESAGLIRESLRGVQEGIRNAGSLPQIESTGSSRVPRAYASAASYLRAVSYEFEEQSFEQFVNATQEADPFEIAELWRLKPFTELVLLESVAARAEQIDAFPAPHSNHLQNDEPGTKSSDDCGGADLSALLTGLRGIGDTNWKDLFERINVIERILGEDPCGAYARMDFESRDTYRNTIAEMAKRSKATEREIAQKAVTLARRLRAAIDERIIERKSHVGYYLIGEGRGTLESEIDYRPTLTERIQGFIKHWPDFSYILSIELATVALIALAVLGAGAAAPGLVAVALFLLPAAECAVALINQFATTLFSPKALAKLDFSEGIPPEFTTMVVVPTLLGSAEQMQRAVRELEIRFLANRDRNLHFALLTDPPDAAQQFDDKDKLAERCRHLIEELNDKYQREGKGSFYLFHRHRSYNDSEGIWMGWERKRGKLLDFNKLLLGTEDNFPVKAGDLSVLPEVKYVITLDFDTQLPRDAARKLVGTIAHPLNRAVINPQTNTVVDGYGILQPRVDISIQSANRSRLASIFSADAGFDIYTRAVSDVYQDLFGEGSFTGKGIYEAKVFQQVLEHRFPCNAILSHDMIEGAYARAGLVSDVELVDDYPSHMSALSRRKHRWVRGDWQIVFWLLPRVPDFFGKMERNPLSIISRWKILDNLRRSLTEIATFVMLLSAWLLFPGKALYWTLVTLGVMALPTYAPFALSILRAGRALLTPGFWRSLGGDFAVSQANLFLRIACLCHQSLVAVDAVVRAIVRMTMTHERLLEWETAEDAESRSQKKSLIETYLEITPWLSFLVGLFLAVDRPESFLVALPLLALWGVSKPLVQWLGLPSRAEDTRLDAKDEGLLRQAALRTWRLFREYSTAEENWLVPDTVQEPASLIVHRISTTNLGLLMNSRLAAMDLGFLTLPEFLADNEKTFDSIDRMPKLNGQMYNWYDTQTLEPVRPKFISSVDNGNLVCCLWTLKQGCLGAVNEPIFRAELWSGVTDHLDTIEELLFGHPLLDAVKELKQRTSTLTTATEWAEALPGLERSVVALDKKLAEDESVSEAQWWGHELCLRITHLENLIYDFAPWLEPQFAKLCQDREIRNIIESERLTLESLPRMSAALDGRLARVLEQQDLSVETRSTSQILRGALARSNSVCGSLVKRLARLAERADALAKSLDFAFLYDPKKKALSIGYDAEQERVAPYYYDLLPSEARAAAFVAIAKGEVPQESWLALERRHATYENERVLLSWTGTMFEYLMPMLWMKTYPNTMLDHATQTAVRSQQKFAKSKSIPWGISEASCSTLSCDGHYHYQAFGVPGLALNQGKSLDLVVSPYSTFLALLVDDKGALENIERMRELGWLGTYGFYEAADFTSSRLEAGKKFEVVRCWLAHHQGMSLMAVANVLCEDSSQRRFHAEPMVAATERLLHEKAANWSVEIATAPEGGAEVTAGSQGAGGETQKDWTAAAKLDTAA